MTDKTSGQTSVEKYPNEPTTCPDCSGPLMYAGTYGRQKIRGRKYKCTDGSCTLKMRKVPYDRLKGE